MRHSYRSPESWLWWKTRWSIYPKNFDIPDFQIVYVRIFNPHKYHIQIQKELRRIILRIWFLDSVLWTHGCFLTDGLCWQGYLLFQFHSLHEVSKFRVLFGSYFPVFGINTAIYWVNRAYWTLWCSDLSNCSRR